MKPGPCERQARAPPRAPRLQLLFSGCWGNFDGVLAPHSCSERFSVLYLDFSHWKTSFIINLWHLHFQFCCLPRIFILGTEVKLPFSGYIFMGAGALFILFPSCKALFIQELMAVLFLVPHGFSRIYHQFIGRFTLRSVACRAAKRGR